MTAFNRRRNGSFKPEWDRGNGWCETKPEWQDIQKAEDKTVTISDLKDLWCPASTSTISVPSESIPGLVFELTVGLKEYHRESKKKRKPTSFGISYTHNGFYYYYPFIPLPNALAEQSHVNAWHRKSSWSQAVKTLTNEIIPSYVEENQAMSLWSLASEQRGEMPEMPKAG